MGDEKEKKPEEKGWFETWLNKYGLTKGQAGIIKVVAVGLAIGILFLQAGELLGVETGSQSEEEPPGATLVTGPIRGEEENELTRLERAMALELEEKLSLIGGAGQVRVMLTLEAGPTIDVVKNTTIDQSTTTEKASDSSTRQTESTNTRGEHVFYRDGSAERPVISRTSRPQVAGVLVVAEGARDARIRARLLDATMVALKVPAHRIQIMPAERGK